MCVAGMESYQSVDGAVKRQGNRVMSENML